MSWSHKLKLAAAPLLLIGATAASQAGCDDIASVTDALCCADFKPGSNMVTVDWGLEGQANVQFGVFLQAVGDLSVSAAGIITAVGVECEAMVKEMGEAEPTLSAEQANDPAEHAKAWCGVAFSAIASVKAQANLTIDFQPPSCEIEASAQANCEVNCQVDASCEGGSVEARCEGGELSGKCDAACEGKCEGSANVAVACEGTCGGTCEGTCEGSCSATNAQGECAGECDGKCTGECKGSCEIEAGANVECSGTCTGSCDVEMKAPKCSAEMTPPSCEADANCSGGCSASASAKAECKPPSVSIRAGGAVDANIQGKIDTIALHLPNLLAQLVGKAELVVGNVSAVAEAAASVAGSGSLEASAALCIIPAVAAMDDAVVNITASVDLSAQLTGSL